MAAVRFETDEAVGDAREAAAAVEQGMAVVVLQVEDAGEGAAAARIDVRPVLEGDGRAAGSGWH